jgi:anti-anti-sigma factor
MVDVTGQPTAAHTGLTPRLVRQLGAPSNTMRAFIERDDSAVIVYVGGEVDACNESTWRRLLGEAAAAAAPGAALIVDLTGLKFVSCSALEALIRQSHWCRRHDVQMRVVTEQAVIRQVVGACAPAHEVPIFPSVDLARESSDRQCARPAHAMQPGEPEGTSSVRPAETSPLSALSRRSAQPWSLRIAGLSGLAKRRRQRLRHVGYTTARDTQFVAIPSGG